MRNEIEVTDLWMQTLRETAHGSRRVRSPMVGHLYLKRTRSGCTFPPHLRHEIVFIVGGLLRPSGCMTLVRSSARRTHPVGWKATPTSYIPHTLDAEHAFRKGYCRMRLQRLPEYPLNFNTI